MLHPDYESVEEGNGVEERSSRGESPSSPRSRRRSPSPSSFLRATTPTFLSLDNSTRFLSPAGHAASTGFLSVSHHQHHYRRQSSAMAELHGGTMKSLKEDVQSPTTPTTPPGHFKRQSSASAAPSLVQPANTPLSPQTKAKWNSCHSF